MADRYLETVAGHVAAHILDGLTPGEVSTVTLDTTTGADLEVVSDGTAVVWCTFDGTVPAVGAPTSYRLPAGPGGVRRRAASTARPAQVRLLSESSPVISVQLA